MFSLVLPTFNEEKNPFFLQLLKSTTNQLDIEKIAIDGGSKDDTCRILQSYGFSVTTIANSSRAARLNRGIEIAQKDLILLHHPRSLLQPEAFNELLSLDSEIGWGGFTHRFDNDHWLLKFTSWYSNTIRPRKGIVYLDHCIFFRRDKVANLPLMPDIEIFEDTELSIRLCNDLGMPVILKSNSTTSSIRFDKNGIYRQAILNQKLKIEYLRGRSNKKMNQKYESGLNLNN